MRKIITWLLLTVGVWYLANSGYMLAKAQLSQFLIQDAWQQTLKDKQQHKPWSWADTYPVFTITIPRLHQHSLILEGASGRNLAFSAARLKSSGMPGQAKSTIISGHRDSHFAYLQELQYGDIIMVQTPEKLMSYQVTSLQIVDSKYQQLPIKNQDELVLTTCYPFDALQAGGTLRYVVNSKPI
ncbi:MAG: class GN sortase [Proteobacteria bacterium]|nr:class GN sortase [Pseudomonadota bacterium]